MCCSAVSCVCVCVHRKVALFLFLFLPRFNVIPLIRSSSPSILSSILTSILTSINLSSPFPPGITRKVVHHRRLLFKKVLKGP